MNLMSTETLLADIAYLLDLREIRRWEGAREIADFI